MTTFAINAMIIEAGRLSGIGHYTTQLARWFGRISREGGTKHRVVVLCRTAAAHHFADIAGIEVLSVPFSGGRVARVLMEQFHLPRLLRRERAAAVLNPAFTGPVRGAARVVTTVHDLYFRVVPELMPRAQRLFLATAVPFCCRRSTCVVTTSASTKRDLERFYGDLAGRITVVPMANRLPAPDALPLSLHRADASPFVLLVAALTGNKNPGPLVDAIGLLRQRYPELRLVHVGRDSDGRLADAVTRNDAAAWVKSRGNVSDAELSTLYQQCLCVAIPSIYEGFGLPLLEAQAAGAPVIAADRSALPEVGGVRGALYFDPLVPASIAETLGELIASPERREELRREGFANQQRYSWEATARAMFALLSGTPAP